MTIKVDLLDRPGKRMGFDPTIVFLAIIVIVFIALFIYISNSLDKSIEQKQQEISEIDKKIRDLEAKIPDIQRQEKENQDLEAQINAIKQLVYDPVRYRNLLDEVALIMPRNIFINSLNIEPSRKTLKLRGIAVEVGGEAPLQSISMFMQNIQKSPYFDSANLASTSRGSFENRTSYSFAIDTVYNPDAASKTLPAKQD